LGPAPDIHLLACSDRYDAVAEDRHRLSLRARAIHGPNARVLDDDVRGWLCLRECAERASENDEGLQETALHFFLPDKFRS
jgi:hypothetical protein